ncbi:MAG TPA: thioredoxin family protein [Burkholderiaceae bacterium]|nr:thioredoxin family protein [Burkholderiaceae bacterium]
MSKNLPRRWIALFASVLAGLTAALMLVRPSLAEAVFPDPSSAASDIAAALKLAATSHKRVLVDFGANWCGDCKVLDETLHQQENASLLSSHFVLVHVNVGEQGIDHNADLAQRYGIPLSKGVPALAVLEGDGRVVYSQKSGEFEAMRKMDPHSVNEFLTRWKRPD